MKKIKKILMIVVMMLTICVSLASCNNNNGDTPNTTDLSKLTAKDVFKEINVKMWSATGKTTQKKVFYSEISSSTSVDPNNSRNIWYELYASYKFEVTKITIKAQSLYTNHLTSDYIIVGIYNGGKIEDELKDKEIKLSSKELFNVEHTFTFEFNEGEFILNKGDYITIRAACNGSMDEDKMRYFNVEVSGRVVVE